MNAVRITINGQEIHVQQGATVLDAAISAGIYIPTLCSHPDLPAAKDSQADSEIYQQNKKIENSKVHEPGKGCGLCICDIDGEILGSCITEVKDGMAVITDSDEMLVQRRKSWSLFFPVIPMHVLCASSRRGVICPSVL